MFFGALTTLNTLVANVTRPAGRALAYSALIFCMHLFGDTFSPPFFGKIIDQCEQKAGFFYEVLPFSGHGIESGFFYMTVPLVISVVACFLGLPRVETDLRRVGGDGGESGTDEKKAEPGAGGA
jgi:hypothetical protein